MAKVTSDNGSYAGSDGVRAFGASAGTELPGRWSIAGAGCCAQKIFRLNVELSLPIFRLALAVFIPWRGAAGFDHQRGMAPALMVCWIEGGAGFFLFSVLLGGAVELPGRSRPAPGVVDLRRGGFSVNHAGCGHARARDGADSSAL